MMTSAATAISDRRSVDLPVPRSQPDYLAAVARLRGMQPAEVAQARVLELGCRTGRNLIPLAERYPDSSFLGIDDSEERVAVARAAAIEQGLTNIEFQRRDLASLDLPAATFDYVMAEGFYSWIDDAARHQLLQVVRTLMAPQGVAYISYRTYPGNYIPQMLGTIFRYEARNGTDIFERVKRGRGMARFLNKSLVDDTPYNTLLKAELAPIHEQDDGALARNYLSAGARPVYLRQFISDLAEHRLQFIGDGAVSIAYTDKLDQVTEDRLSGLTAEPLKREQYRDVLRNRRYRQSLVCHADVEIDRELSAQRFAGLYLEGRISPENPAIKIASSRTERFIAGNGMIATTSAPVIKAALVRLNEAWPAYITLDELVDSACDRIQQLGVAIDPEHDVPRLTDNLLQSCAEGLMAVHAAPPSFTSRVSAHPIASPWARWQARRGETPTNRRHQSVHLEAIDAHALAVLDGTRDPEALLSALVDSAVEGRLTIFEDGQPIKDAPRARPFLATALLECMTRLAEQALLIA